MKRKKQPQPYLPRVKLLLDGNKHGEGYQLLMEGAQHYTDRLLASLPPTPVPDAALLIAVIKHVAAEMERADPEAVQLCRAIQEFIKLPTINLTKNK